jgi:hypothetical protein
MVLIVIQLILVSCFEPTNTKDLEWEYMGLGNENIGTINSITIHPDSSNIIYVTTSYDFSRNIKSYVFISEDSGVSWDTLGYSFGPGSHFLGVKYDPVDSKIIYLINGSALFKSIDNGRTWMNITGSISTEFGVLIRGLAIDNNNTEIIYATTSGGFNGTIYKSINSGTDWVEIGPTTKMGAICPRIDPFNSHIIYFADSYGGIMKSVDGGNDWAYTSLNTTELGVSEIIFKNGTSDIYTILDYRNRTGYNYGVLKSANRGTTFLKVNNGLPKTDFRPHDIIEDTQTGDMYLMLTSIEDSLTQLYQLISGDNTWLLSDEWFRSSKLRGVLNINPECTYIYRAQKGIFRAIIN